MHAVDLLVQFGNKLTRRSTASLRAAQTTRSNAPFCVNLKILLCALMQILQILQIDAELFSFFLLITFYAHKHSNAGALQFLMKEHDKAMLTYKQGLEQEPDNQELKDGLDNCIRALNRCVCVCACECVSVSTCMHLHSFSHLHTLAARSGLFPKQ